MDLRRTVLVCAWSPPQFMLGFFRQPYSKPPACWRWNGSRPGVKRGCPTGCAKLEVLPVVGGPRPLASPHPRIVHVDAELLIAGTVVLSFLYSKLTCQERSTIRSDMI